MAVDDCEFAMVSEIESGEAGSHIIDGKCFDEFDACVLHFVPEVVANEITRSDGIDHESAADIAFCCVDECVCDFVAEVIDIEDVVEEMAVVLCVIDVIDELVDELFGLVDERNFISAEGS